MLSLTTTTTTTTLPKRQGNYIRFTINRENNILCRGKNSVCHEAGRVKEAGHGGVPEHPMTSENDIGNGGATAIFCQLC